MKTRIRTQVWLLTLAPTVLIATALIVYFTSMRVRDLAQSFKDQGQTVADQLAAACGGIQPFGAGATQSMLRRALFSLPDLRRITLMDDTGKAIVAVNRPDSASATPAASASSELITLEASVVTYTDPPRSTRNPSALNAADSEIGRIRLTLSQELMLENRRRIVTTGVLVTIACWLLALIPGWLAARELVDPVLRMQHLARRQRKAEAALTEDDPALRLGDLQQSIKATTQRSETSQRHISQRIRQATDSLHQTIDELEAARWKALELSRIKSEFLANMSHEIRTPMNGVMGFIALLSKTDLKPTQQAYLRTLRASAENLMVILNDILDLSKIEAGKFRIRRRNFNLREVLEDAVLLFTANAHQKGLSLLLDIEPDVPSELVGDAPRITQIVTNFVSNAVKFTERGGVEVTVSKSRETARTITLNLTISDTGIGIAPQDQQRLFTAFDQLDNPLSRPQGGTGLGLAISRRLVDMMKGEIRVKSQVGLGTVFEVLLMAHKRAGANITSTPTEPRKALHTLVISADDALARACAHILEYGGMRPRTVNSLEAAAAYLSDRSIDDAPGAIVVDYHSLPATGIATLPEIVAADQESPPALIILGGTDELTLTDSLYQVFETVQFANTPPTSRQLLPLLPAFDRDCSGPATRFNELDDGQAVSTDRPTIKALLADDNHINRRLARIFLDQLGVEVDEAKTGAEVLALSRCRPYDIILMDIHMPDLDGLEATRQLRGETDNPNRKTPVIALTADALGRERQRCLAAGMNGYLCKPITEGTLQQLLGKWCPAHPEHMRSTDSIGTRTTVTS